tara:strand:- start:17231 stop:17632 length:402 start_codon:yes stop_codon:yes gene_type:complete
LTFSKAAFKLLAVNEKEKRKYLMDNFLVDPAGTNFFHQNKQAQKLLAFFPDIDFWKWLNANYEDLKVYTLLNLLKPNVMAKLRARKKIKAFSFKDKPSINISEEKFGEDVKVTPTKPETVLDFLRDGSKEEKK